MFARITSSPVSPERIEELLRTVREQAVPTLQQQAGFVRAYYLVDRQRGTAMVISLWASREALMQAEAVLDQRRGQVAQAVGMEPPTTEVYEVALEV